MIDTSVLVAAIITDHVHHAVARSQALAATKVPVIVLAEGWSQLRRHYGRPADEVLQLLNPWRSPDRLLPTSIEVTTEVFERAVELDLGGNIHDALIAGVCAEQGLPLATLDRRQHTIALALGVDSTYLLA